MLPAGGMGEAEQARVQGLTSKRRNLASDPDAPRDSAPGARAVKGIPDQRMAPMGKMNPDLMRSAGGQTAFEAGRLRVKRMLDAIARVRRFAPAFPDDSHLLAVGGAAADVTGDLASARSRHTPHERRIGPVDSALGKVDRQGLVGSFGLGDDHQPAGVLVEAVHDARPPNSADSGQARAAMADQSVDEGAVRVSRRRMDNQSCGLVDDDQMFILEADLERHWLRGRRRVAILGQNYDEILAVADPPRGILQRYACACDVAGFDQPLDPGPRQHRETERQHAIEAQTGLVGSSADRRCGEACGRRLSCQASNLTNAGPRSYDLLHPMGSPRYTPGATVGKSARVSVRTKRHFQSISGWTNACAQNPGGCDGHYADRRLCRFGRRHRRQVLAQ